MKNITIDGIEYRLVPFSVEDKYKFTVMMFEQFDEKMDDLRFEMQCLIDEAEDYYGYDLSTEMRDALIDLIDVK